MRKSFVLEYWKDDDIWVGRLQGIPGISSHGSTLEELEKNISNAFQVMYAIDRDNAFSIFTKVMSIEIPA